MSGSVLGSARVPPVFPAQPSICDAANAQPLSSSLAECLRSTVPKWAFLPPSSQRGLVTKRLQQVDANAATLNSWRQQPHNSTGTPRTRNVRRATLSNTSSTSIIDGRYSPAFTTGASQNPSMEDPVLEMAQTGGRSTLFHARQPRQASATTRFTQQVSRALIPLPQPTSASSSGGRLGTASPRRVEPHHASSTSRELMLAMPFSPRTLYNTASSLHHRNRAPLPDTINVARGATPRSGNDRQLVVGDDVAAEADVDYPIASIPFLSTRDPGESVRWNRSGGGGVGGGGSNVGDADAPFDAGGVSWSDPSSMGASRLGRGAASKRLMDVSPTRRVGRVVFLDPGMGGLLFDTTSIYMLRFNLEDLVLQSMTVLSLGDVLSYNRIQEGADAYRAVRMVRVSTREEEESKKRLEGASVVDVEKDAVVEDVEGVSIEASRAENNEPLSKPSHSPKRPSLLTGIEYRAFFSRSQPSAHQKRNLFLRADSLSEDELDDDTQPPRALVVQEQQPMLPHHVVNAFGMHSPRRSTRQPVDLLATSDSAISPRAIVTNGNTGLRGVVSVERAEDAQARQLGKQMMQLCRTNPEWLLDEVEREFDDDVHTSIRRAAAAAAVGRRQQHSGKGGAHNADSSLDDGPVSLFQLNECRATEDAVRLFMELSEVATATDLSAMDKRRREYRWYSSSSWQRPGVYDDRPGDVFQRLAGHHLGGGARADATGDDDGGDDAPTQHARNSPSPSDGQSDLDDESATPASSPRSPSGRHHHAHHPSRHHHHHRKYSSSAVSEVTRAYERERRQIAQVNVRKFVEGVELEPPGTAGGSNNTKTQQLRGYNATNASNCQLPSHLAEVLSAVPKKPPPRTWK